MNIKSILNTSVWIYGSGSFARGTIESLSNFGVKILGIIDHRNLGGVLETGVGSFPVYSVKQIEDLTDSVVVLSVCNLYGNLHEISVEIKAVNPGVQIVTPVTLFSFYYEMNYESSNYWLTTDFNLFSREEKQISIFRELLSDSDSKSLFDSIIRYRRTGLLDDLPTPLPLKNQYLADDLLTPPTELRILDLGACKGENLDFFIAAGRSFIDGYLFEPDVSNFKELTKILVSRNLETLKAVQAGAWNHSGVLKFDSSGNPAATLSDTGNVEIKVLALDDYLPHDFRANFIKMDIEGAEMNALLGLQKIIGRDRPHLALSVYHKPSDLWEIGNYLNDKYPGVYKYSLRMYGHQTFDTVLYAVPIAS